MLPGLGCFIHVTWNAICIQLQIINFELFYLTRIIFLGIQDCNVEQNLKRPKSKKLKVGKIQSHFSLHMTVHCYNCKNSRTNIFINYTSYSIPWAYSKYQNFPRTNNTQCLISCNMFDKLRPLNITKEK